MFDGIAAILVGAYLAVVAYNGQLPALFSMLKQEKNFIAFLAAAGIIYWIYNHPATHEIGIALILVAFVGMGLNILGKGFGGTSTQAFSDFGSGKIGLFDLIGKVATGGV